jgi:hypothetical protein
VVTGFSLLGKETARAWVNLPDDPAPVHPGVGELSALALRCTFDTMPDALLCAYQARPPPPAVRTDPARPPDRHLAPTSNGPDSARWYRAGRHQDGLLAGTKTRPIKRTQSQMVPVGTGPARLQGRCRRGRDAGQASGRGAQLQRRGMLPGRRGPTCCRSRWCREVERDSSQVPKETSKRDLAQVPQGA